jgi:hypothetical protein
VPTQPRPDVASESGAASLEALRPRLYKAIRAALLETEDPEARSATVARRLAAILAEGPRERTYPEELAEARQSALNAGWQRALNRGRRLAGAWFDWRSYPGDWVKDLQGAVTRVAWEDEQAQTLGGRPGLGPEEARLILCHFLRQRWCGGPQAPETFNVSVWLPQVGFFAREPLEIGTWARLFHTLAALHREGRASPAQRQEARARVLRQVEEGQVLASLADLVIYLEEAVRQGEAFAGPLPPPLDPRLFPGLDPEPVLKLLQEGLSFLEGSDPETRGASRRLAWLQEFRDLVDLKDLLLLFLAAVPEEAPLPPPSEVLDRLKRRGFPIRHQDFRDEYQAWLVPLKELPAASRASLRWTLDPEGLRGDLEADLDRGPEREARRDQILQAFKEAGLAFCQGRGLPLPRAELLRPAARFALAWRGAQACREGQPLAAAALAQEASQLLPEGLRKLIRPRKGYEVKHKAELTRFVQEEAELFEEAWDRGQRLGRSTSLHDDGLLFHLAGALALQKQAPDLAALTPEAVRGLSLEQVTATLEELASHLSLDSEPAAAPAWQELQAWLKEILDWPGLMAQGAEAGLTPEVGEEAAGRLFTELARQFYRLVLARARQERNLPPLPGDQELLYWLAAWFTPVAPAFQEWVAQRLLADLEGRARQAVRESYPLMLENREELQALTKYFLAQELQGEDLENYARHGQVSALPQRVARRLAGVATPPDLRLPGGLAGLVQELLRPRAPEVAAALRQVEESLLALLPRSDCGSCGAPGCLAFVHLLVRGQAQVAQCLQSSPAVKARLTELLAQAPAAALAPDPYALTPADQQLLAHLLDPYFVALRHRLQEALGQEAGQELVPLRLKEISILQIGKSPEPALFHRYLADYLGEEAAQRLGAADRAFLTEHGDLRLAGEARELEESLSWLVQEQRAGLSVFALAPKDPEAQAREAYGRCLFLSDLSPADRARVQEFRLGRFLPDFLADWERALPEHWAAGRRIEDWEDFAQITAKSYWHQEHTPAPGEVLAELPGELTQGGKARELVEAYLENLLRQQLLWLEDCRQRLESLLRGQQVTTLAELDFLVTGLVGRAWREPKAAPLPARPRFDRRDYLRAAVFRRFNLANLTISGELRVQGAELAPRVLELLTASPQVSPLELARLRTPGGLAFREMNTLRTPWIKATIQARVEGFLREEQEVERFRQGHLPFPGPLTLRRAARQLYWSKVRTLADLLETLGGWLDGSPQGREALQEMALRHFTWERLRQGSFLKTEAGADPLVKSLDQLLRARFAHDVPKLKAYMFLLARMEGNLDKLTALLREIRETSDIIEAAWLAFTEERVAHPRAQGEASGPRDRVSLLASRLPEQERFQRYLVEGLPRGEPRDYTQAYRELLTLLQFYVVTAGPGDTPEEMLARLESGPYDLTGLSREALLAALRQEAQNRDRLAPRKISICTYVLAHRLAALQPRLAQSAATFLAQKGAFLKEESLAEAVHHGQVAAARGVDLSLVRNELYRQISELLMEERTESFAGRIGQILARLEEERLATLAAFQRGELNRQTAFYILGRFQKDQGRVLANDLGRFLRQYQPQDLDQLRARLAPQVVAEVEARLKEAVSGYQAALQGD